MLILSHVSVHVPAATSNVH